MFPNHYFIKMMSRCSKLEVWKRQTRLPYLDLDIKWWPPCVCLQERERASTTSEWRIQRSTEQSMWGLWEFIKSKRNTAIRTQAWKIHQPFSFVLISTPCVSRYPSSTSCLSCHSLCFFSNILVNSKCIWSQRVRLLLGYSPNILFTKIN